MKTTILSLLIISIGVVFGGYPISIPFTTDTTNTVSYNLIDTDPSCYHRHFCPNFRPGGKLSTFPNSEEKYQHILHNMFRLFSNYSLEIKYGKWINGANKNKNRTYFPTGSLRYCGDTTSSTKPLYWYSDANQLARFKQWDFNTCNKSWYLQPGNSKYLTCQWGQSVINNVPINRCELFPPGNCIFDDRTNAFCQEDRCWFYSETQCSGNECVVGEPECELMFHSALDYSGIGFIEGYDGVTNVYSRYTHEISYLLPSGAHFDERTKIVQEDYNQNGKYFTLWLQYFDVNSSQTVESCYSLYGGTFHAMDSLVKSRPSDTGEFYSAMFTSNHLPPSQCEPYAFICKTSLGNYFRLPEDKHYYFGTEWLDRNDSNHADLGLKCKENHYFWDDDSERKWIVNGGPTLNKEDIWYYQDTINYGECIGCNHINALECWSECILNEFSEEYCFVCPRVTEQPTTDSTADPTEIPTEQPTTDPTGFPTQMPTLIRITSSDPTEMPTEQPTIDPTAFPTQIPILIGTTILPTIELTANPTNSPLTCPVYAYDEYPTVDGADYDIDFDAMTKKTQVILGPTHENIIANQTGIFIQRTKRCDKDDGCNFECSNTAACFQAMFTCNSLTGCNIFCKGVFSCGKLNVYAINNNGNSNGQQIHVECSKDSCQEMEIFIDGVDSAHIHCKEEDACTDMIVHFNNITSRNNHNTSVTCYVENACTNLKIFADGELSKLHMYGHSENIILNNGYGWSMSEETITCDLDTKFVKYEYAASQSNYNYLETLIRNKQGRQTDKLPCEGINVTCLNGNTTGSCIMTYVFAEQSKFDSLPGLIDTKFFGSTCVYVALYDMVRLQCQGNCKGWNSLSPTIAPSSALTYSPSNAPSTEHRIPCTTFFDCDWTHGYWCKLDPVCLGKKGYWFCRNKKVCLNTYGRCTCNGDCDGDHKCGFRGGWSYGVCIKYQ